MEATKKKGYVKFFQEPPKSMYERHIFDKTIDELVKETHPPIYNKGQYPFFDDFGEQIFGFYEHWSLKDDWENFSEVKKWKYVALCNKYKLECRTDNSKEENKEIVFYKSVDELVKMSYPSYEGQHPLFQKFGVRTGGICDYWQFISGWETFPEIEKWEYVALCAIYWNEFITCKEDWEDYDIYLEFLKERGDFEEYKRLKNLENF